MMRAGLAALILVASLSSAHAAQRTFVASNGSDSSATCSIAAPCRSFAAALTHTDPNGEIVVLDSAAYGRVTIAQSVSIVAPPGVYAGISVFASTNGIDIATPGVKVTLRGLTINGQGGNIGINLTQGSELIVEQCEISNMATDGITISAAAKVSVIDSVIRDSGAVAIRAQGPGLTVAHSKLISNGFGIALGGNAASLPTIGYVSDVVVTGSNLAVSAFSSDPTSPASVHIRDSTLSGNNTGASSSISSNGVAQVTVASSLLAGNDHGIACNGIGSVASATGNSVDNSAVGAFHQQAGCLIESAGDNSARNNAQAIIGTLAPYSKI